MTHNKSIVCPKERRKLTTSDLTKLAMSMAEYFNGRLRDHSLRVGDAMLLYGIGEKEDYLLEGTLSNSNEAAAVGYLHDFIEEGILTLKGVEILFGEDVAHYVATLTRGKPVLGERNGELYFDYINRIAGDGGTARLVKIEDLKDNMRDLKRGSLLERYKKALEILQQSVGDSEQG